LGGVPLGLPEIAAGVMALALNAYALLGGADFGGGVWDLLARGPRRDAQRRLISETIAPIWEANHVWLILVVVMCFTCFPSAFARLATVLHVPLTLMLVGIVLRGSAFVFRAYDVRPGDAPEAARRRWGLPFAVASIVTPVLLGVSLGALASGAVGAVDVMRGTFAERFVAPWATPFAVLAATYLTVEADDPALADDFRRRALAAQGATVLAAVAARLLAPSGTPVQEVGAEGALAKLIGLAAAACALGACWALWRRRWTLARLAAQGEAACLVWGWAWAQFPDVIPSGGTASGLAAPPATIAWTLGALAVGTAILLPSFVYLFRVFMRHGQGALHE
jgi:cytochrome d ubiquinol oxidase subunit II